MQHQLSINRLNNYSRIHGAVDAETNLRNEAIEYRNIKKELPNDRGVNQRSQFQIRAQLDICIWGPASWIYGQNRALESAYSFRDINRHIIDIF